MDESFRTDITFGDVINHNLLVTHIGGNRYRLEEAPFVEDVFYKDVIEAERSEDGSLVFQKVAERSGLKNYDYLLPRTVVESEGFEGLLEKIESAGGYWTHAFGGLLLVSLPASAEIDLSHELEKLQI